MIIIPAIDIINGRAVRLTNGDYSRQKVYSADPVEVAKQFADAGLQQLHLVDLDGAREGRICNMAVLEKIATATSLVIDFGGGVKKKADVENILNAGAARVTISSLAVKQPQLVEEWLQEFGTDHFLIGADVLHKKIRINGWLENSGIDFLTFIEKVFSLGVKDIFCTDISKDGMMKGPSVVLYKKIREVHPGVNLIASGGVSKIDEVLELKELGCAGVIIGKAIYEGLITLKELVALNTKTIIS